MTLSELRTMVYRDLEQPSSNNDRLSTTQIDTALNDAYRAFCVDVWEQGHCTILYRRCDITAVTTTAVYDLPPDFIGIEELSYEYTRILHATKDDLRYLDHTWLTTTAAATVLRWYLREERKFGLYPAPSFSSGTKTIRLYGPVGPENIGRGIATVSRTANVVTVTTTAPHGILAGEGVTLTGVSTTAPGTSNFNGAFTVSTVPSSTTWTHAQTAAAEAGTGGNAYFTNGIKPLLSTGDAPVMREEYHPALAHWAVAALAEGYFASAETAAAVAEKARAEYAALVKKQAGA